MEDHGGPKGDERYAGHHGRYLGSQRISGPVEGCADHAVGSVGGTGTRGPIEGTVLHTTATAVVQNIALLSLLCAPHRYGRSPPGSNMHTLGVLEGVTLLLHVVLMGNGWS